MHLTLLVADHLHIRWSPYQGPIKLTPSSHKALYTKVKINRTLSNKMDNIKNTKD